MKNKYVAILITCYNRCVITLQTLEHLKIAISRCNNCEFDIYLVDDGSTDGTGEHVKNSYPNVNVINGDGSLFWGGGTNLAWCVAKKHYDYDYYLLCNDDGVLFKDSLETLFRTLNNRDDVIVSGAFHSSSNSSLITYGGKKSIHDNYFTTPNGSCNLSIKYMNGNFTLIPKDIFRVCGYIEPRYKQGMGDYDYGLRAVNKGFNLILSDKCVGICDRHDNDIKWLDTRKGFIQRLKYLYSPMGPNPIDRFHYNLRHFSIYLAMRGYVSTHIKLLFPCIFNKK